MTATQINRRKALSVVVAAPALAAVPALANASEDANLIRLWDQWNAQVENFPRCRQGCTLSCASSPGPPYPD